MGTVDMAAGGAEGCLDEASKGRATRVAVRASMNQREDVGKGKGSPARERPEAVEVETTSRAGELVERADEDTQRPQGGPPRCESG